MRPLIALSLAATAASAQVPGYLPATFTDPGRADRVKATQATVERMYQEFARQRQLPGLAYGVVVDGVLLYSGGAGHANLAEQIPADPQSLFRIASMSKSVTAMAILRLRDEGKLELDAPASRYLPDMRSLAYLTTDARPITVRDLLTHAAGFPEDNPWGDRQLADTDEELMQLVRDGVSFSNVPGITYEYSNLGFALLGRIVAVVSGMPYQRYTKEQIFAPLGMRSTIWEYADAPARRLAHGYRRLNGQWLEEPLLHDGSYGAMGGLITSIEDFSKYVALHLSAWPPRSGADGGPIGRGSLREMHQPWRLGALSQRLPGGRSCASVSGYAYGLRWGLDCDGKASIGHSGGLPGFGSNWTMLQDYGIAVLAFDNLTYAGTSGINAAVLDTIVALAKLEPRALPVSAILEQRKAELLNVLPEWTDAERSSLFAENFFPDTDLQSWRARTRELYGKLGAIRRIGPLKPENQLRGTFVIEGEQGSLEVFFTLTPERPPRIQQLTLREVR